jgi:CheY-like chemotaxis protein
MMEQLKGSLTIRSSSGEGTKVVVKVNLVVVDKKKDSSTLNQIAQDISLNVNSRDLPAKLPPRRLRRVLTVDDSKVILKMYARWGKESGHVVVTADDGDVAVSIVEGSAPFDVILMDKEMSRMGGVEATTIIRNLGFNGVVALVSGSVLSEDEYPILNGLFDTIIIKGDKRTYQDIFTELDQKELEREKKLDLDVSATPTKFSEKRELDNFYNLFLMNSDLLFTLMITILIILLIFF